MNGKRPSFLNQSTVFSLSYFHVFLSDAKTSDSDILQAITSKITKNEQRQSKQTVFEMAAMPFPCNGIFLIQGNLPRVSLVFT